MLSTIMLRSKIPRGRRADSSAIGTATTSEITNAKATSSKVTGRSLARTEATLWPLASEWPR